MLDAWAWGKGQAMSSSEGCTNQVVKGEECAVGYLQVAKKQRKVTRSDSESGSDGRQSSNFSTLDSDYPYNDQHQSPIVVDALVLVGTLKRPPKGFVSFEHEEDFELCAQTRLGGLQES